LQQRQNIFIFSAYTDACTSSCKIVVASKSPLILFGLLSFFSLIHTPYMDLLTLLSLGLLLTLLAETEARLISTKITRNNMISELSIRGFPFDIA